MLNPVGCVTKSNSWHEEKLILTHVQPVHRVRLRANVPRLFFYLNWIFHPAKMDTRPFLFSHFAPVLFLTISIVQIHKQFWFYMRPYACPGEQQKHINTGRETFFSPNSASPSPPRNSCYCIFTIHWVGISKTIILISTRIHPWRVVKIFRGGEDKNSNKCHDGNILG